MPQEESKKQLKRDISALNNFGLNMLMWRQIAEEQKSLLTSQEDISLEGL